MASENRDDISIKYKAILRIEGKQFRISKITTKVGHNPKCTIQLDDPSVSRVHIRIDWTKVGLVITNLASYGNTFLNDVALKPLEAMMIKRTETTVKLGELEGQLILHRESKRVARQCARELYQIHSKCLKCRISRDIKIRVTFDERRRFHLKFDMPKRNIIKRNNISLRKIALTQSLYDNFSHLTLMISEPR